MGGIYHAGAYPIWVRFACLLLGFLGCAHYDVEGRRLCAGDVCYRWGELPGWRLLRHKGGAIAFFQDQFDAVAQANATCRDDAEAASLEVLTRHLLIGYTEVQVHHNDRTMLAGREALHTIAGAKLDGVPVMLDLYVIKRNGCIFDLSLAAPPGRYHAAVPDFSRFVFGFSQEVRS
jgi:hypothetical protein